MINPKPLFVVSSLLLLTSCYNPSANSYLSDDAVSRIQIGMAKSDVIEKVGKPHKVNTTIRKGETVNQFIYKGKVKVVDAESMTFTTERKYLYFKNNKLVSIQM